MSEKNKFEKDIKNLLDTHQVNVNPALWKDIEQRITPPVSKRRKILSLWWLSAVGSVAVVLLVFLLLPNKDYESLIALQNEKEEILQLQETSMQEIIINGVGDTDILPISKQKVGAKRNLFIEKEVLLAKNNRVKKTNVALTVELKNNKEIAKTRDIDTSKEKTAVNLQEESKTGLDQEIEGLSDWTLDIDQNNKIEVKTKQKNKKIVLATIFSRQGGSKNSGLSQPSLNSEFICFSPTLVNAVVRDKITTPVLTPDDYSDHYHHAPLSAGLLVSKELNEGWALETGLVYTYLRSDFSRENNVRWQGRYEGRQELHYLGIPLSLRKNIFSGANWNIFISGGGMLEKGIQSVYQQKIVGGSRVSQLDVRSEIDGWQWSVNGGIGIEMMLDKHIGLYVSPKATYYLNNNQPMSARTEEPFVLGLTGGLRFGF